ncbi:MAG TPA: hypothetical protein VKR55_13855 [Bradyrhizobium sp.]|uniref:hypothetical protein n=1 Tax=Bradyrhizobium sp. TaxID=376 RepID=UPI002B549BCC|nr:hypothetical protein [Bradyrhizobium sp.]HLZ03218.1 hypothetical protein [Bradyrhizobium sp.]
MQDTAISVSNDGLDIRPASGIMRRYLLALAFAIVFGVSLILAAFAVICWDGGARHDFFSEIVKDGDADWYRNFGGRHIPQIQDEDIFYNNVGHSVASAKASDIVFLGPSFVSYAVDRQTLQSSPQLGGLKIYNMAFVGIRGGEFSRLVIKRWGIRPPLWIINADDQFVHFFSNDLDLTIGPEKVPIGAVQRNRMRGWLTVVGRNLRWRIEDIDAAFQQGSYSLTPPFFGLYRNVSNGDMLLDANPAYVASGNKPMRSARDGNCHTNAAVVDYARRFLKEVGGNVVLTLVPHSQSCLQQARELADALHVELIAPPFDGMTTVDGGGHLDKNGAKIFTGYLARELVKTAAFKRAFAGKIGASN